MARTLHGLEVQTGALLHMPLQHPVLVAQAPRLAVHRADKGAAQTWSGLIADWFACGYPVLHGTFTGPAAGLPTPLQL